MKKTQVLFAMVLLAASSPFARAEGPGTIPPTPPSNGAAIPKPCTCPGGTTSDGAGILYGRL